MCLENGLDYITWDMGEDLERKAWLLQQREMVQKITKLSKLNILELLETKVVDDPNIPWYTRIANKVTGTANGYKKAVLEEYGPALAEFLIERQITLG